MTTPSVLLIEDDAFFAEILRKHFSADGFEVRHALNGEDGLASASQAAPSLIVLDIAMPKKNGFETLEALKADKALRTIPVMMLTNLANKEDIDTCFRHGACEYLIKSHAKPDQVVARARHVLGLKPGFTVPELFIVLAVIASAILVAAFQARGVHERNADNAAMANLTYVQSSLLAAAQEKLRLADCRDGDAFAKCALCRGEACEEKVPLTGVYLPPSFGQPDAATASGVCKPESRVPCLWTVEKEGSAPVSLERYRLRFFLRRDRGLLKGGMTHVMFADGKIE